MIITRKKPVQELLAMLGDVKKVAIVGCGSCATSCQTGGEKEAAELKAFLEEQGMEVVGIVIPGECCHKMLVKKELKVLRDSGAEAIIGMACGDGVQTVADNIALPVYPANDTMFLGQIERVGMFHEYCKRCGDCVLGSTGGIFDVSHMGRLIVEGPDRVAFLQKVLTSNVAKLVPGRAQYCIIPSETGGAEISGPRKNDLNALQMEGHTIRVSKTGYTGDPIGWELFIDAKDVNWLWNRLIELGAQPTGLGARDPLRLEAGLPLYGHEMGRDASGEEMPIFAVSLARFAVSFAEEKGEFIAKELLKTQKEQGTSKKIVPIALTDRGVMRAGMDIYRDGVHIGWVTSGTMVPYYQFDGDTILDKTCKRSIGFAYIDASVAMDDVIEIDSGHPHGAVRTE